MQNQSWWPSWISNGINGHKFGRYPRKDYLDKIWFHPKNIFGLIWQGGSREEDQIHKQQTLSDEKISPNILCQLSSELKKKTQCSVNFLAFWQNFYNIVITDGVDGRNYYLCYFSDNCFWLDTEQNTTSWIRIRI